MWRTEPDEKSFQAGIFIGGLWRGTAAIPFGMDWRTFLVTLLRGVLKFVADEYYPIGGRRQPADKDAPQQPPNKDAPGSSAPKPPHTTGWGPPSEPSSVTVIIETDAGATSSVTSASGSRRSSGRVARARVDGHAARQTRQTLPPRPNHVLPPHPGRARTARSLYSACGSGLPLPLRTLSQAGRPQPQRRDVDPHGVCPSPPTP